MTETVVELLLLAIVAALAVTFASGRLRAAKLERELAQRGQTAEGTLLSWGISEAGCSVTYKFLPSGNSSELVRTETLPNPPRSELTKGASITVRYLPDRPECARAELAR